MATSKIYEQLTEIFRDTFDDDTLVLSPEMTAEDVEDWDSLSHIRLIVAVERAYGIRFTTTEVSKLDNVGQFADLVESKEAQVGR